MAAGPQPMGKLSLIHSIDCKQGAVRSVRFNVDGNYCITGGADKTVKLWNPHKEKGLLLKSYSGHGYEVLDACGSCDNAQIVSGGMDKILYVWDVVAGKPVKKYRGHFSRINCVCFNEEASVVFSGSLDGTVRVWDLRSKNLDPLQVLNEARDSVTSLCVSDHEILTGSADGHSRRYDMRQGQMYADFFDKSVTSVNFTRDGACALVSTLDSIIRLIDKDTGELLQEFTGHKNEEYRIDSCLNHSDSHVYSGSEDGCVYCWDLVEGKVHSVLQHPLKKVVHSISAHPTSTALLTACLGIVYVWKFSSTE